MWFCFGHNTQTRSDVAQRILVCCGHDYSTFFRHETQNKFFLYILNVIRLSQSCESVITSLSNVSPLRARLVTWKLKNVSGIISYSCYVVNYVFYSLHQLTSEETHVPPLSRSFHSSISIIPREKFRGF